MMKLYTPRPWAPLMTDHIVEVPRDAVWAPMGSGKTVTTITALQALQMVDGAAYPTLIIGPLRVARKVWHEEVAKWAHLLGVRVVTIIGNEHERQAALQRPGEIYAINFENVPWLVGRMADKWPFRAIVVDEARKLAAFRLKQGAMMPRALSDVAWLPQVAHFVELTGTPAPNGLKNLWGQLWFLDRGRRLGLSFKDFEDRWFAYKRIKDAINPGKTHIQTVILPHSYDEIHAKVRDLCLSVDLRRYVKLDEVRPVLVKVELPPEARRSYNEMARKYYADLKGHVVSAANAAVKSNKLLQLANGAAYRDPTAEDDEEDLRKQRPFVEVHTAKLEALQSIVDETDGVPLLVVINFKSDAQRIRKVFPDARLLDSVETEDAFKRGEIPMLLLHPKSAGHGVDGFQNVCWNIAFFSQWWSLELRQQVIERIGPTRQMQIASGKIVTVYDIIAENTVDENVMLRHESNCSVQEALLASAERWM